MSMSRAFYSRKKVWQTWCNRSRAMNSAAPLLEIRGLSKTFVQTAAAVAQRICRCRRSNGIDLDIVAAGSTVAVLGRSGSGKSTLARCLAGLRRRTRARFCWKADAQKATKLAATAGANDLSGCRHVAQPKIHARGRLCRSRWRFAMEIRSRAHRTGDAIDGRSWP